MHRNLSMSASLGSFAVTSMILVGCTINNVQSDSTGGNPSIGGAQATGGAAPGGTSATSASSTFTAGASATGGTQSTSGTVATGGKLASGGTQSTGGSSGTVVRTGGTSAMASVSGGATAAGGTNSTGGARTGGTNSTGGARTGGSSSTGGAHTGGTGAAPATQTGGTTAALTVRTGGASATGGSSSTGLTDTDGDGVADTNDLCPNNPAITKPGKMTFSVVFTTAAQGYPEYLDGLKSSMLAAGAEWAKHFPVPHDVSLEIQIDISDIATANGRSADTVYSKAVDSMRLYQQGTVYEILTGTDPNGSDPDVEIAFGIDPLSGADGHYYWSDPDPVGRTATMPNNAVDTVSTCLHELGHAFGFNGWRDWATGALPGTGDYESFYDYLSTTDGTDFFFEGPTALASYGKPVPETYGNLAHIGNYDNGHPGEDLDLDLMRGTRTLLAHRYYISNLDLAVLADIGMPIIGSAAAKALCDGTAISAEPPVVQLGPSPAAVE